MHLACLSPDEAAEHAAHVGDGALTAAAALVAAERAAAAAPGSSRGGGRDVGSCVSL
jgi:hypothetical protein